MLLIQTHCHLSLPMTVSFSLCLLFRIESVDTIKNPGTLPEIALINKEDAENFAALFHRLPEEDRFLLQGKYVLGFTDEELSSSLGCKASGIRMKLTRARHFAKNLFPKKRTMNKIEILCENYENASFALLMYYVAQNDGQAFLELNEMSKNDSYFSSTQEIANPGRTA